MMKRFWRLLLALLLISCLAVTASAAETSGTCGANLTWVFEDTTGTLTISGTGDMKSYHDPEDDSMRWVNTPWDRSAVKTLIIEEGVTSVGNGAFCEAALLTSVTFPDSLKTIGESAFYECVSLKDVVLPPGLSLLDSDAFIYCALDSLTLPANDDVEFKRYSIYGADITTLVIPAGVTKLPMLAMAQASVETIAVEEGNSAYSTSDGVLFNKDQTELVAFPLEHSVENKQYTLPDHVTAIGAYAFHNNNKIASVTLHDGVNAIGLDAFRDSAVSKVCISDLSKWVDIAFENEYANPVHSAGTLYVNGTAISDLVIPEGTASIGAYAFYGMRCTGSITLPASVTDVGTGAFRLYSSAGKGVHVSDLAAWTKIRFASKTANPAVMAGGLYVNGKPLTELSLPEGTTSIGDYVFAECKTLTKVSIPDTVTSIGNGAFLECDGLTSVTVPDSVTTIGECAFEGCGKLQKIQLPKNLKTVSNGLLNGCYALTEITIPETVTEIGATAFYCCSELTSVNIPQGVTSVGNYAFYKCRGLTEMLLPDAVTVIGDGAFYDCSGIRELTLSKNLKKLGDAAFYGCKRIKKLSVPGGVEEAASSLAKDCVSLESVTLGSGITLIDTGAFEGCTKLKSVTIPATMEQIWIDSFEGCTALTEFYLEDMETWIDLEFLFRNLWGDSDEPDFVDTTDTYKYILCENESPKNLYIKGEKLTDAVLPDGRHDLREYAFHNTTIKSVTVPGSYYNIPEDAFSGCSSLEQVVMTGGMELIEHSAFRGCKKLKTVSVPATLEDVEDYAFYECAALSKVYYGGSKTRREKIDIGSANGRLKNASWVYNHNVDLLAPVISATGNTITGKTKVTWSAVEGAERYRVYRATSKSGSYSYLGYTTALSYTDKTAKAGTNYYYKVTAFDNDTQSASFYSNIVNRVCDLKKPVVTLKVDTASGKPKVTWEKISGAAKYYIARATSENGTYSKLAAVTDTSYVDKTAKAGKTYYYKVKALHAKDAADSVYSETVSRICDLKKPVVSIKLYKNDPRLTWEKISGAEKYQVYRATSKSGEYKLVKTTKSSTSFTDTDVKAGKTYYYKVKAIHKNSEANSSYSAIKYIKAK